MSHNKVLGIGLSRTGTKSLATALNQLGVKTRWFPHDSRTHRQLMCGDYRLAVLDEYDGITDTPAAAFYPQFDQHFPGSKYILTTRDKQAWLRSCRNHWQRTRSGPPSFFSARWRKFGAYIDAVIYGCVQFDETRFSYAYDVHQRNMQHFFRNRPEDLLVMDFEQGDGWQKLCPFLGLSIPETPFPRVNDFQASTLG